MTNQKKRKFLVDFQVYEIYYFGHIERMS